MWQAAAHADFATQAHRRRGDTRFFFVHNWVFPPFQCVITAAVDPAAPWLADAASPQGRAWRRFLAMTPAQQKDCFKVIPCIEDGPWFLKNVVPRKPVLIGRKVKTAVHHKPDDYLEITLDVASNAAEQYAVGMVMGATKSLAFSLASMIEGRQEDELPECLLTCPLASFADTARFQVPVSGTQ